MTDLAGRTVLLTGALSGLGPHIAARLRAEGASLVLSARNQDALERLATTLGSACMVVADLSRRQEVEALAAQAGAIDILIANAAVPASGELVSFSVDEIDRALDVNLRAAIVLANRLLPGMLARRRGHVVLMASLHGKVPSALVSVYNATKFGLRGFLRGFGLALRQELQGTGVGVSVINPTYVSEAGMWAETNVASHPLAGRVTPAQVAAAVVKAIKDYSSPAIHDIPDATGRARAIAEAVRVLRPGGQLLIADIRAAGEYRDTLQQMGLADVATRPLGWRIWYGGPWMAITPVSATKQT